MRTNTLSIDLLAAAQRSESLRDRPRVELERAARDYERFLELAGQVPGPLAPTRAIDEMWHLHMLHPVAYHRDCLRLFGKILDHDGGFGLQPAERPALGRAFERTAALWMQRFGEPYGSDSASDLRACWHNCQSRCWHACSSKADLLELMKA